MTDFPLWTVSELTRQVKDLVEANFPYVWVAGEISNCTRAGSGHVYLTLKDEGAQIRGVLWRGLASQLKFELHDGLAVIAAGPVEIYQPRGTYQLIIEELIPQGIGALELAFRQLQEKLLAEGLFDPARKRPLPRFPRRIALVTSPTGAAVRDLLKVLTRRWQASDVVIVPVAVQGAGAAEQIAAALGIVHRIPDVDVVITGRGGGSLEDLWAFNEEIVARAVANCRLPVISAVGHEIDVSIADLVADCRALTPSEAGELVVPSREEVLTELRRLRDRLAAALNEQLIHARLRLDSLAARRALQRPQQMVHDRQIRVDELAAALRRATAHRLHCESQRLSTFAASLEALSPLKVLSRGYSITHRAADGEIIRDASALQPGEELITRFQRGRVRSRIESLLPDGGGRPTPAQIPSDVHS